MNKPRVCAIILAAGISARMNCDTTKQLIRIAGESVIRHTVRAFIGAETITDIVVVARQDEISLIEKELSDLSDKLMSIVVGGKCRAESAKIGFCEALSIADFVAIHDGARCLVTPEMIDAVVSAAITYGAASAGMPVTDTVKKIDGDLIIKGTVRRDELYFTTTPQVFSTELYERALREYCIDMSLVTDDNMLVEALGVKIKLVDCGRENVKITMAHDLDYAEFLFEKRKRDA